MPGSYDAVVDAQNADPRPAGSAFPTLRLWYLDHPFWRAECVRMSLHIAGVPFEDKRVGYNELYRSGMLTFGTFPALEVNGRSIAQTHAMAAYVGKLTGFYPEDPWLAAKVDEVFGGLTDATDLITSTMGIRDPNRKVQTRMQMTQPDGRLTMLLNGLESLLQQNGSNGLVAGDKITVADFALWRAVGWISSGCLDGIALDYIPSNFPNLAKLYSLIDSQKGVQQWKQQNARHYKK